GDGSVIATPGADFEHPILGVECEQVGHDRHHMGCAHRLILADRERAVGVGVALLSVGDELVARHAGKRRPSGFAFDATRLAESVDEFPARGVVIVAYHTDHAELDSSSAYIRLTSFANAISPSWSRWSKP